MDSRKSITVGIKYSLLDLLSNERDLSKKSINTIIEEALRQYFKIN